MAKDYPAVRPTTYKSPLLAGTTFHFESAYTIYPYDFKDIPTVYIDFEEIYKLEVTTPSSEVYTETFTRKISGSHGLPPERVTTTGTNNGIYLKLEPGIYTVTYSFKYTYPIGSPNVYTAVFTFQSVQNRLPLKKLTITDVINRELAIAEPIRKGENPRFRLNGMREDGTIITEENKKEGETVGQAALFDTIYAPQFSFTKQTLREIMQDIGRVIHGEFRMKPKQDSQGYYFEVSFDMYGGIKQWMWANIPYESRVTAHTIESFCSHLDSNVENLVNTLNRDGAVIKDPGASLFKSVRTDRVNVRVTDLNMIITTQYPIYSVEKLECSYSGKTYDITQYVFEGSEYDRLSSYSNQYPQSRLYALRYQQGQKNIDGLNFKRTKTTDVETAFGPYAIVAILQQLDGSFPSNPDYPQLAFRITYIPIYNTRVAQAKPYYKDNPRAAALIMNQQSNVVESKYYGEYLKGMAARLGNIEEVRTYIFGNIKWIPKAGMKFNDDYYIAAVATEFMPNYIQCTIALSKDFNRLSQYIGVSSVKRYSEISESQSSERNVLLREFIVIGDKEQADGDTYMNVQLLTTLGNLFRGGYNDTGDRAVNEVVSCVIASGEDYQGNQLPQVCLPVISSAFGNSISFSWEYADNYSAGDQVVRLEPGQNPEGIEGYFQQAYRYTDLYGRMYYYNFQLISNLPQGVTSTLEYPRAEYDQTGGIVSTKLPGRAPLTVRKDNREKMKFNFQVDYVTNRKGFIIGSALAENSPTIKQYDYQDAYKIYIFDRPLDKFIDHVNGTIGVDITTLPSMETQIEFVPESGYKYHLKLTAGAFPTNGQSWAIITPQTYTERMVEDEQGNEVVQREVHGGDVLIAQNLNFKAGDEFTPVYFTPKRKIYNDTVWVKPR